MSLPFDDSSWMHGSGKAYESGIMGAEIPAEPVLGWYAACVRQGRTVALDFTL